MKRFTETEKWRDPWFQKLKNEHRTLWLWLCDRVDNAGVVDICWPILNAETGCSFTETDMKSLEPKIEHLENGKYWIPSFTRFQFGELSPDSRVHQSVVKLLIKHSLSHRVSHTLPYTPKDKDKEKDKDPDGESERKPILEDIQVDIPQNLNTPEFLSAWDEWIKHRKQLKKKLTPSTMLKQLKKLSSFTPTQAAAIIDRSIEKGWMGLYGPDDNASLGELSQKVPWLDKISSKAKDGF